MAEVILTIGTDGGRDHATISAWEAATSGALPAGDVQVGEVYADAGNGGAFVEYITISGTSGQDASTYRELRPGPGQQHTGTSETGVRAVAPDAGVTHNVTLIEERFVWNGVETIQTNLAGTSDEGFRIGSGASDCRGSVIKNALIRGTNRPDGDGIYAGNWPVGTASLPIRVENCALWNWDRGAIHAQSYRTTGTDDQYFAITNVTAADSEYAIGYRIQASSATVSLVTKNVLLGDCSFDFAATGAANGTLITTGSITNFDEDGTVPSPGTPNPITFTESTSPGVGDWAILEDFTSGNQTLRDYALVDVADNDVIDGGTGPGVDSDVPATDIVGAARSGATCEPGAFEIAAVGAVELSGTSSSVSGGAGKLSLLLPLSGTGATVSGGSGLLLVARTLSGTSSTVSGGGGTLTTGTDTLLSGTSSTVSGGGGSLTLERGLSGTSSTVSGGGGELTLGTIVTLSGTSNTVSGGGGVLSVAKGLAGTSSTVSGGSGDLTMAWALAGTSSTVSGGGGTLSDQNVVQFLQPGLSFSAETEPPVAPALGLQQLIRVGISPADNLAAADDGIVFPVQVSFALFPQLAICDFEIQGSNILNGPNNFNPSTSLWSGGFWTGHDGSVVIVAISDAQVDPAGGFTADALVDQQPSISQIAQFMPDAQLQDGMYVFSVYVKQPVGNVGGEPPSRYFQLCVSQALDVDPAQCHHTVDVIFDFGPGGNACVVSDVSGVDAPINFPPQNVSINASVVGGATVEAVSNVNSPDWFLCKVFAPVDTSEGAVACGIRPAWNATNDPADDQDLETGALLWWGANFTPQFATSTTPCVGDIDIIPLDFSTRIIGFTDDGETFTPTLLRLDRLMPLTAGPSQVFEPELLELPPPRSGTGSVGKGASFTYTGTYAGASAIGAGRTATAIGKGVSTT